MIETSAGAIIYTKDNDEIKYYVILDSNNNYGFPKGHLEKDETELEAAYREIKEEVNLEVIIDEGFKRISEYSLRNGNTKRVVYYVAKACNNDIMAQKGEVRSISLLNYEDTLNILTFDSMKEIFTEADRYIKERNNDWL